MTTYRRTGPPFPWSFHLSFAFCFGKVLECGSPLPLSQASSNLDRCRKGKSRRPISICRRVRLQKRQRTVALHDAVAHSQAPPAPSPPANSTPRVRTVSSSPPTQTIPQINRQVWDTNHNFGQSLTTPEKPVPKENPLSHVLRRNNKPQTLRARAYRRSTSLQILHFAHIPIREF